jgi:hypothetical protein
VVAERANAVVRIKHLIAQQRPPSRGGWRQALDSSAFSGASRTLFLAGKLVQAIAVGTGGSRVERRLLSPVV